MEGWLFEGYVRLVKFSIVNGEKTLTLFYRKNISEGGEGPLNTDVMHRGVI